MKHYQTIYYRHRGAWTDKDSQRLNNLMNEESDKISSLITSQFISLLRNKIEKLKAK